LIAGELYGLNRAGAVSNEWIAVPALTGLLVCGLLEFVVPHSLQWSYRAGGRLNWRAAVRDVFGVGLTHLTELVRAFVALCFIGALSPYLEKYQMRELPLPLQLATLFLGAELVRYWTHRVDDLLLYTPEVILASLLGFGDLALMAFFSFDTVL